MAQGPRYDTRRERRRSDAQQVAERVRQQELDDIRELMATALGRRIMWRLLAMSGVYRLSYTGNSETYFREGQRSVGLRLIADIHEACPEAYVEMLKEHRDGRDEHRAE